MRKSIFIFLSLYTLSVFSQKEYFIERGYKFFNSEILKNNSKIILDENGSPTVIFGIKDSFYMDIDRLMFKNKIYNSKKFWDTIITNKDKEYFKEQIISLRIFNWDKNKLPNDLIILDKKQEKIYSRKLRKNERRIYRHNNIINNRFEYKLIERYSIPIFNKKENFAIIYYDRYLNPLSSIWLIDFYLKINGKWMLIASDIKGIS